MVIDRIHKMIGAIRTMGGDPDVIKVAPDVMRALEIEAAGRCFFEMDDSLSREPMTLFGLPVHEERDMPRGEIRIGLEAEMRWEVPPMALKVRL